MKVAIILFVLIGIAHARPQVFSKTLEAAKAFITSFTNENKGPGEYSFNVETSDGQKRGERRYIENAGTKDERPVVEGYYSYNGTDGKEYVVGYKADEGGFQPEGEHLPPAANVKRRPPKVGIPSAAIASLYETSNDIQHHEFRIPIKIGNRTTYLVRGSYSYIGPDGNKYVVEYEADERGFRPTGEHIPLSAGVVQLKPLDIPKAAIITLQGGIGYYETSNGIQHHEYSVPIENENGTSFAVYGFYSYIGPDNKKYKVQYASGENGFRPRGEHIPPAADVVLSRHQAIPLAAIITLQGGLG
ncbi:hypothetical protein FQR65_LT01140 [Abscondita terminalis]|nr:hypothetical protein FQR65_LT01140 [Abscondita terminalis]